MTTMRAMVLRRPAPLAERPDPLALEEISMPSPAPGELLVRVRACAVCRTDLDIAEGRLAPPGLPLVPGHQVIGDIVDLGAGVSRRATRDSRLVEGTRVGVAWIHSACGQCRWCRAGDENLCPSFHGTGYHVNGGYAEYLTVPAAFAHAIPDGFDDASAAPLLCAGAIGYRSLRLARLTDGERLGLTGFGASGHLVLQLARARYPRSPVFVFARSEGERAFARSLGASWTGDTTDTPPDPLAAIIDTTPAWTPTVEALARLAPGGRLVVNAIRKTPGDREALLRLDYATHLWMEREIKSVANVTRADVREFLSLAADLGLRAEHEEVPLERANEALRWLVESRAIRGSRVLRVATP